MLEPLTMKVVRAILKGEGGGNISLLFEMNVRSTLDTFQVDNANS